MTNTNSAPSAAPYPSILSYSLGGIKDLVSELGQPSFRAKQLTEWVWSRGALAYDDMSNLPQSFREKLSEIAPLNRGRIVVSQVSKDRTRKYLIEFADGVRVEAVGLPSKERLTVCLSTQAGCAMGCTFCATGQGGFVRNLSCGEIADQVRLVGDDFGRRVTNVVTMGQGEPFANYDETLAGLRIINSPVGFAIGARHITLSTCGLVSGIERLASEPEQFTLAVSLHSALQSTRDALMPGVANQTIPRLGGALMYYYETTGRRPSFEYALTAGHSDSIEEITALRKFAKTIGAHINLIPLNPISGVSLHKTSKERAYEIVEELAKFQIEATVRTERGGDIDAACGQLTQKHSQESLAPESATADD